ncbi:MAG TPA: GAF domain-containing protein, partial [Terracidiphilus sp.]
MSSSLWSIWNTAAKLGLAWPSAAEWTLLALLAASLLTLRAFRETYLKIWIVGWMTLLISRLAEHCLAAKIPAPFDLVVVQATFVLAVGLLAGAVLVYARMKDLVLPLMVITPILVGVAGARVLLWPEMLPLRVALEVGYRIVVLAAALALLRARRGRWEPATWLLALCLPLLHLTWAPFTDGVSPAVCLAMEITLGLSMLLVVFDEARARTRRLLATQAIATSITGAQHYGNVVQCAIEQLQRVMRVRGMWFRLYESGNLVATHAEGLSADFLRDAGFAPVTEKISELWQESAPLVETREAAVHEPKECLAGEKVREIVTVPVVGAKAAIGLLMLGNSGSRKWTPEELDFLQACAKQLALAVENFRLLEQVLRSQRQWMNTFDSIHDVILAHDAEFK